MFYVIKNKTNVCMYTPNCNKKYLCDTAIWF